MATSNRTDTASPPAERVAWYTLLALTAVLPLTTSVTRGVIGGTWSLTDDWVNVPKLMVLLILAGIATVAWAVDTATGARVFRTGSALVALAAFAVTVIASTFLGSQPLLSLFGSSDLKTGAVTWLTCAWVAVLLGQYVTGAVRLRQISWAFVGGGAGVALIGLLQAVGADPLGLPIVDAQVWVLMRASSTLGNPDYAGTFLVAPSVVALALWSSEKTSSMRWLAGIAALACSFTAFLTLTRAAWIGLFVGLALFALLTYRGKRPTAKAIGIAIGGGVALIAAGVLIAKPIHVGLRFSFADGLDAFSSGRVTLWTDAARIIANHPLAGTGADRLAVGGYEVQRAIIYKGISRFVLQDPHNAALLIAGIFGIPALLAVCALVYFAFRDGFRWLREHQERRSAAWTLYGGWLCALAALVATSLLSVYPIASIFSAFLVVGVVVAPSLRPTPQLKPLALTCAALAVALIGVGLYGTSLAFSSDRHLMLAKLGEARFHLEEAMRLTPWDTRTRTNYYLAKINASRSALTSEDIAAARDTAAQLDGELRMELAETPGELLFQRLRVYAQEMMVGAPGYDAATHAQVLDEALAAFPGDPEFTEKRDALKAGVAQ